MASRGASEDSAQHGICVWTVDSPACEQQDPSRHAGRTLAASTVITAIVRVAALGATLDGFDHHSVCWLPQPGM
jgi:hypothetical protein